MQIMTSGSIHQPIPWADSSRLLGGLCTVAQEQMEFRNAVAAMLKGERANMKRTMVIAVVMAGLGLLAGLIIQNDRQKVPAVATVKSPAGLSAETSAGAGGSQEPAIPQMPESSTATANADSRAAVDSRSASPAPVPPGKAKPAVAPLFSQAIECLTSPQSSFAQRQEALEQLRNSGKLDQAISELEQRVTDNTQAPQYPTALGRLYLQKAGTIQDLREQGILGLKADQQFEAALNLDPNNWEARFTKAVAMTYWPTQLNKGEELFGHFTTLLQQQEAQAPQPQFAQTYAWMGDAYQKYGYADYAKQIWQRGAGLFPQNQELKSKLVGH